MSEYPEPLVARILGVKKKRLVEARKQALQRGGDWVLAGAQVAYTLGGLKKLCGALGLDSALVETAKKSEVSAGGPGIIEASAVAGEALAAGVEVLAKKSAPVWMKIIGVPGNNIIVHCEHEGQRVAVRVKSNATFIAGLWIQATPLNHGQYFAQVGKPPRWKGDRFGFAKPDNVSP